MRPSRTKSSTSGERQTPPSSSPSPMQPHLFFPCILLPSVMWSRWPAWYSAACCTACPTTRAAEGRPRPTRPACCRAMTPTCTAPRPTCSGIYCGARSSGRFQGSYRAPTNVMHDTGPGVAAAVLILCRSLGSPGRLYGLCVAAGLSWTAACRASWTASSPRPSPLWPGASHCKSHQMK